MYVCLCCWVSARATLYVSQEDVTTSPDIILVFVFVLSGICARYMEDVETSPHIIIHIFVFVLSGICHGHTVHGGCWNFTTYHPYFCVCIIRYLPWSHCTWRMLQVHQMSSSLFLCLCCQVSALVTLYMSQEDAAAASDTLINAVNWYKKNKVGFCRCFLCVFLQINLLSLWIHFLWVKCLARSKPHTGAMSLLTSVCDLFPCLKPPGICKPLCSWDRSSCLLLLLTQWHVYHASYANTNYTKELYYS